MFKVSPPASLQTFIDTPNCVFEDRVRYSTVHISNVFCDGHLEINYVGIVRLFDIRLATSAAAVINLDVLASAAAAVISLDVLLAPAAAVINPDVFSLLLL